MHEHYPFQFLILMHFIYSSFVTKDVIQMRIKNLYISAAFIYFLLANMYDYYRFSNKIIIDKI